MIGLVSASVLFACLPGNARAVFPGRDGLIAYTDNDHDRDGRSAIVTVRPNGKHRRVIYRSSTGDDTGYGAFGATWSPRGNRVAFEDQVSTYQQGVFVAAPNGSGRRRVSPTTLDASEPSFSPNGTSLVFAAASLAEPHAPQELYTMAVDGGTPAQITSLDSASAPTWLSDGRIAFQSDGSINTIRADGSDMRRVPISGADSPSWSPLGRNIVFVRHDHLYVVRSDGSHLRRLTSGRSIDGDPAFSPDGLWIVFTRTIHTNSPAGDFPNLWLVDIHGHHARRIIREPPAPGGGDTAGAYQPAWQAVP
jgi:Tol biopolymer transport system component